MADFHLLERRLTLRTRVRWERLLPAEGEVVVQPGQLVGPETVVARCPARGQLHLLDVSKALDLRRDRAGAAVCVTTGDEVQAGQMIAETPGGIGRRMRSCTAPVDGTVKAVVDGLILLEAAEGDHKLPALLGGSVASVIPERGAAIEAVVAWIQGVWGRGGEARGPLRVLVDHPLKPLIARRMGENCQGALIVGGRIEKDYVLEYAVKQGAAGIIAGSVEPQLREALCSLPIPVLITEGFGTLAMNRRVLALLQVNEGREAVLCAAPGGTTGRSDLLIPLEGEEPVALEPGYSGPLAMAMHVAGLRAPYLAAMGTVTGLPGRPYVMASGARLPVAEVELHTTRQRALIPVANLEIVR